MSGAIMCSFDAGLLVQAFFRSESLRSLCLRRLLRLGQKGYGLVRQRAKDAAGGACVDLTLSFPKLLSPTLIPVAALAFLTGFRGIAFVLTRQQFRPGLPRRCVLILTLLRAPVFLVSVIASPHPAR